MSSVIYVDLDGTIGELCDWLEFHDFVGQGRPDHLAPNFYMKRKMMVGAGEYLWQLKKDGYTLILLTARHEKAKPWTMEWLKKHDLDGFFTDVYHYEDKVEFLRDKDYLCLIDDFNYIGTKQVLFKSWPQAYKEVRKLDAESS